jgi:prophage antirepressor-like protein
MGVPYPERRVRRLDSDQYRENTVRMDGHWVRRLLVSESGAVTLCVCNQIPENRELRRWLTQEVVPMLREGQGTAQPALSAMCCSGGTVKVLYWHDAPWVRLRDMPDVMARAAAPVKARWWPLRAGRP